MAQGIYIHVPFCRSKCPYCDFYSVRDRDEELVKRYCLSVIKEIGDFTKYFGYEEGKKTVFLKEAPDSIYFGGGTPTLLSGEQLGWILDSVDETFGRTDDREITIEANPGTVDRNSLKELRKIGFNRLSIGAQSFDEEVLSKLGRTHRVQDTEEAVRAAKEAGFDNISIDLIFGIEDQTESSWEQSLRKTLELAPAHISLYSLEFMEGTVFSRLLSEGRMKETDPEDDRRMYETAADILKEAGYVHYEISNFAKPGFESRHNLKYWNLEDYAGFGPAAHSYMRNLVTGCGQRYCHEPDLAAYTEDPAKVRFGLANSYSDDIQEYTITALRLTKGIDKREFRERFGQDFREFYGDLTMLRFNSFIETGHAYEDEERIGLTLKGFNVSNRILSLFV